MGFNNKAIFVLLFTALTLGECDYLDDYFTKVVASFNNRLNEIGVSSLKVNDTTVDVNRTINGIRLTGTVAYTNVLVLDVATLELKKEGHRGEPADDGVHLFYQIDFPNLTIFSDVEAKLKPVGEEKGTAELLFLNTSIAVYLDKNYTTGTTDIDTKPYSTMGPATNFLPVSDVMDAAARLARLELGYNLLWDTLSVWCADKFTPLMVQVINDIEFPMFPPEGDYY